MEKVKIGDKEYKIGKLKLGDMNKILRNRDKKKLDDYDFVTYIMWFVIEKYNPEQLTVQQLEDSIDIDEYPEIQDKIYKVSGMKKYFDRGLA